MHDAETAGRVHWDFNDAGECAGMGLFAAVRLLKAIEVGYRAATSCRAPFAGRPRAVVCMDCIIVLMAALFSLTGAGVACAGSRVYVWYQDSLGRCNWQVVLCIFWTTFLEVVFAIGDRLAVTSGRVAQWNSFRSWTLCKKCDPCVSYYSCHLASLNFLLDLVAALVLLSSGCHLGWFLALGGPWGVLMRWYAFGAGAGVPYVGEPDGFALAYREAEEAKGSAAAQGSARGGGARAAEGREERGQNEVNEEEISGENGGARSSYLHRARDI
eukprot:Tamp_24425.p1 GENE.Tamp_24425~~Tamp_24425.p1  ORF type:complete len:271 (+),score=22.69 Tamp_24425:48-860(+)